MRCHSHSQVFEDKWALLLDTLLLVPPLHNMVVVTVLQPLPLYAGAAAARISSVNIPLALDFLSENMWAPLLDTLLLVLHLHEMVLVSILLP
jgi:hypothetical protein